MMTSKRLEILKSSLSKKEAKFDEKLDAHFSDVRSANGQPLNDKRCGAATMARWGRQNDTLRSVEAGIELTKQAIEKEESKISFVERISADLPAAIKLRLENGQLTQWRKHPNTFFVAGVDKGRIVWDSERNLLCHRYLTAIPKEQFPLFKDAFNNLKKEISQLTQ